MKKELKVVAIVLVALIVFLGGFGIGATKGISISVNVKNDGAQAAAASVTPATTPAAPAPATDPAPAPATTPAPAGNDATTAAPAANDATTAAPSGGSSKGMPSSKEEIVAKYNELINGMKNKPGDCTMHKKINTQITVTKAPAMQDQINSIVQGLVKPVDETVTFANGMGTDGSGNPVKGLDCIVPCGRETALAAAGVKDATCTPDGAGYKMVIVLNEEKSNYDGTNTVKPVHHESCLTPLNLATLELPMGAKITQADMSYPGATLTLNVDGEGRLTKYDVKLPMSGSGSGKLIVSIEVGLEGSMDESYEFTY